jgi:SAM-dependent methyltransferase
MNAPAPPTYDYAPDLEADTAAAHVVRLVGHGRRVLEVGAGPGSITRALIETGGCDAVAVELDEAALARLREICPRAYRADLNDPAWVDALRDEDRFDAVVAADVLEHLIDPWRVLADMKRLLRPDGHVVVSLPHVGHLGVVACLLDEDFEYREWGLLDRTHIRFFGIGNVQALFDLGGYTIVDADAVVRRPEATEFGRRWTRLPHALREQLERHNPFGTVYQVIVKATPGAGSGATSLAQRLAERMAVRAGQPRSIGARAKEAARGFVRSHFSDRTVGRLRALLARVNGR